MGTSFAFMIYSRHYIINCWQMGQTEEEQDTVYPVPPLETTQIFQRTRSNFILYQKQLLFYPSLPTWKRLPKLAWLSFPRKNLVISLCHFQLPPGSPQPHG